MPIPSSSTLDGSGVVVVPVPLAARMSKLTLFAP